MIPIQAILFDLGDVLTSWQPPVNGKVDARTLKRAMTSQAWHDFDRGRISEEECFEKIGKAMKISSTDLRDTVENAKLSLRSDPAMMNTLSWLCAQQAHVKIYLASNISQPHWNYVRETSDINWELFEGVFISAEVGMRKPDVCFYEFILNQIGLKGDPSAVMFFDDKLENVATAQALGFTAFQFENAETTKRQLRNRLADPVARGLCYLNEHAGEMWSTVNGIEIKENFAQLLILEASGGRQDLVTLKSSTLLWNYFQERPTVSTPQFPDDFDTTSIALSVLEGAADHKKKVHGALDVMLKYRNCDGLPMVYADYSRPRFDPVVCVHIFTLFHLNGRSSQLVGTWAYVMQILKNRGYKNGTYYYTVPDYFLFSLSRLIQYCHERSLSLPGSQGEAKLFINLFSSRCLERVNASPEDALSLAIRIIACRRAGISPEELHLDAEKLRLQQESDGGWPPCEIYKVPSAKAGIGNRGVVTALAIKALGTMRAEPDNAPSSLVSRLQNRRAMNEWVANGLSGEFIGSRLLVAGLVGLVADLAFILLRVYQIFEKIFLDK